MLGTLEKEKSTVMNLLNRELLGYKYVSHWHGLSVFELYKLALLIMGTQKSSANGS